MMAFDGGALSFRNRIIGGDFTLNPWQRGTSFTAPASGAYTADRFVMGHTSTAVVNIVKAADAPTVAQAGVFTQHCLHLDITTADTSIAAGDQFNIQQKLEGYNAALFGFGQAGTRYVTLSFWVKSTKTGTFCVAFRNNAANRSYVAEYTVLASNTWEREVITIPVDTAGTWTYDNSEGLSVVWTLASGSTYQTTAGTWQAGNFIASANQVNALDSTSNDFKIALVQLEAGPVATAFEARPFGVELALCQRYYEAGTALVARNITAASSTIRSSTPFKVTKRAAPTTVTVDFGAVDAFTTLDRFSCYQSAVAANTDYNPGNFTASAEL
jgi:hypothetical protein